MVTSLPAKKDLELLKQPPALPLPEKAHEKAANKGQSPAEYVHDAMKLHQRQYAGSPPPALVKWIGDGQLAVLPKNRMLCAIGLTAGLMIAGNMAKIGLGRGLDGSIADVKKVPTYLQKLHQLKFSEKLHHFVKDYNPAGMRTKDRWLKYAQWATYSLGGFTGVKIGTDLAYRNVKNKLENPNYLEDYLPRVSMHQGDTWGWMSAATSIFGSASGLWVLPIPGLNYGLSLAGRVTSMQDRSIMIPGLQEFTSGGKTSSYMRLREGMNYLCHYAATNPAETPTQIEFLAYALLGPVFKDKLTVEQIEKFTDAVHAVRDTFWKEGGIPKADRKQALKAMRHTFTGEGLESLLINLGLNPGNIDFMQLNGMVGKIGNLGAGKAVQAEQDAYGKALAARLDSYVEHGLISQERADWAKEGIDLRRQGKDQKPLPPLEAPREPSIVAEPTLAQQPEQEPQEARPFAHEDMKRKPASVVAATDFTERVAQAKATPMQHSV